MAERGVLVTGSVKDIIDNQPLTFRRLAIECDTRRESARQLTAVPHVALCGFASFLRSPCVVDRLREVKDGPMALADILQATTDEEMAEALLTMPEFDLKGLVKLLVAIIGDKRPKPIRLACFTPHSEFIWEASDIDSVVGEFHDYLKSVWEEGHYLKIETN